MKKILFICVMMVLSIRLMAAPNPLYVAYIEKWREEAERQEEAYAIPACITLAQGLLESAAGQSELAIVANNHFGIKCTSDWTGLTYVHDDDTKDECFRRYADAAESFRDHSLFLKRGRYARLYELRLDDYRGWAYGLRNCGYATDPQYPEKLIRLIEDYGLAGKMEIKEAIVTYEAPLTAKEELRRFMSSHESKKMNGIKYIIAREGDTFANVAFRLNEKERTLRENNDALGRDLEPGDRIYLSKKKKQGLKEHALLWVHPGESLWMISQREGIMMNSIYEYNGLSRDVRVFTTRQKIWICKPPKEK